MLDRRLWKNTSTQPPGLLAYWKWEDNNIDEVAGYLGVWQNGSEQYVDGWGRAAKVDGSNYDIRSAVTATRCGDREDLTWSFWYYPNNVSAGTTTCWRGVLPAVYDILLVVNNSSPFVRARVYGQSGIYGVEPAIAGTSQVWNFVCMTWIESSDTGVLYHGIDGAALQTWSLADSAFVGPRRRNATVFGLGSFTVDEFWLDDFRYYGVAKDAAGVQALYDEGKTALGL
jgi:hypothetical protein